MKIVKIIGGLGNQMFQYALFLALRERFPDEEVKVDCSYFKTYHIHTGLELDRVFGVDLPQANFGELLRVTWPVRSFYLSRVLRKVLPPRSTECLEAKDRTLNEKVFSEGNQYYDGYWLDWRYFRRVETIVRQSFMFKLPLSGRNALLLSKIRQQEGSVSIHIRRGDYLKVKDFQGLCGIDYYGDSIKAMQQRYGKGLIFYIFSDDIEWCKSEIAPLIDGDVVYVDWNRDKDSPIDMQLMAACNHNIIANSTFSWWAAYLKERNGEVFCPRKWNNTTLNRKIQYPTWKLI